MSLATTMSTTIPPPLPQTGTTGSTLSGTISNAISAATFAAANAMPGGPAYAVNPLHRAQLIESIYRTNPRLRRTKLKILDDGIDHALASLSATLAQEQAPATNATDAVAPAEDLDSVLYANRPNAINRTLTAMYTKGRPAGSSLFGPSDASASAAQPIDVMAAQDANGGDESTIPVPGTPKRRARDSGARDAGKDGKRRRIGNAPASLTTTGDGQSENNSSSGNGSAIPTARLADLGGIDSAVESLLELVAMPLAHPEIYAHTGVAPPRGILLHGPPGCGKTSLANAIAGELGVPFFNVAAPAVVSGMSGESEKKIREIFAEAAAAAPCLMFIDEIDAITPKRESAAREMERRIVAQLLTCMDEVDFAKNDNRPVIIIGATNRPDAIDPALRRAGRFDREIAMGVPDEDARVKILTVLSSKLRLSGDFDFREIAKLTPGYVGADLTALTAEAGLLAVKRIFETLKEAAALVEPATVTGAAPTDQSEAANDAMDVDAEDDTELDRSMSATSLDAPTPNLDALLAATTTSTAGAGGVAGALAASLDAYAHTTIAKFLRAYPGPLTAAQLAPLAISQGDFVAALAKVQPSAKREGFATVPDVTWAQIGALAHVRAELRMAIVEPVARPELFARVGIAAPAGVLLWGPPGCGKTLLAKAVANEAHSNFISVKGPELLNKYVGESERAVRQVFARARASSPCVIFFDEIDALVPRRDDAKSEASSRVVNTLLTELDGLDNRRAVYVIAATNRPDILDPAMLRPGRLDKLLYVDLPTAPERAEILAAVARKTPTNDDVDLAAVAHDTRCNGFSGADLAALVREASVTALRDHLARLAASAEPMAVDAETTLTVTGAHFDRALDVVRPSVAEAERRSYASLHRKLFSGGGVAVEAKRRSVAPSPSAGAGSGHSGGDEPSLA